MLLIAAMGLNRLISFFFLDSHGLQVCSCTAHSHTAGGEDKFSIQFISFAVNFVVKVGYKVHDRCKA